MNKENPCKSIFKSGETSTTQQEVTRAFIMMINQIERSKKVRSRVP